jgi:MFS family permease
MRALNTKRKDAMMRLRRMRRTHNPPAPRRFMAWLVWGISALFVLLQFALQLSSGEMLTGLMHSFSVDALGAGLLASTYYYVYVLLQSPAGMVVDRFGPRRVLSIGAFICGAGTLLFGASHSVAVAAIARMMMGGGAAFAFVGSLYLIGKWFPIRKFALMVGIAEAIGMVGSLLGGVYMADFVQHLGWRNAMFSAAAMAGVLVILLYTIVRDTPYKAVAPKSIRPKGAFRQDFVRLMRNKKAWYSGFYSCMMFSVITVFVSLWGIPYFQLAHHMTLMSATVVSNIVVIGVAIGSPLVGWLDGRVDRRRLLSIMALLTTGFLCVAIYIPTLSTPVLVAVMLAIGVSCSAYVIPFAIAHELATPSTRSTYMGFTNMMSVGSAPIFQPVVGLLMSLTATGFMHHGHVGYTVADYQVGLSVVPLLAFGAVFVARLLPQRTPHALCEEAHDEGCAIKEAHECILVDQVA